MDRGKRLELRKKIGLRICYPVRMIGSAIMREKKKKERAKGGMIIGKRVKWGEDSVIKKEIEEEIVISRILIKRERRVYYSQCITQVTGIK